MMAALDLGSSLRFGRDDEIGIGRGMMPTRRQVLWGSAAAALLPSIAGRAADLRSVKCIIPIPSFDESFAPFAVAKHMGYFKEEGLDVTFVTVRGNRDNGAGGPTGASETTLREPARHDQACLAFNVIRVRLAPAAGGNGSNESPVPIRFGDKT
jgi:hypothetical protein